MSRFYSILTLKGVDEARREIFGVASTGETDRMGDIVEPLGLTAPAGGVSLLWQHDSTKPVGWATLDPPTSKGVTFRAKLPKPATASPFRDAVEMAWGALVHGTARGVSIGFRSLKSAPLPTGGIRFLAAEIVEISLVSVPANSACSVTAIKALDQAQRRKSGGLPVVKLDRPLIGRPAIRRGRLSVVEARAILAEIERRR